MTAWKCIRIHKLANSAANRTNALIPRNPRSGSTKSSRRQTRDNSLARLRILRTETRLG